MSATKARGNVRFEFDGAELQKLESKLELLPILERSKAVKAGMRKAGFVVKKHWTMLIPTTKVDKESKNYERNVKVKIWESPQGGYVVVVGGTQEHVPHQHLVEFGHRMAVSGTLKRLAKNSIDDAGNVRFSDRVAGVSRRTGLRGKGKIVGRVPGQEWKYKAATQTKAAQARAMAEGVKKAVEKALQG